MIETTFENMNDINAERVTVLMPYPVSDGDYVEFNDVGWTVINTAWIIETDPVNFTHTVKLHVRVR